MKKNIIFMIFMVFAIYSCDNMKQPAVKVSSTYPVSGEWYVTLKLQVNGVWEDVYGIGYYPLLTYNLSSNIGDSIWVDDEGLWPSKFTCAVNVKNRTFSVKHSTNVAEDSAWATVTNGQVLMGKGVSFGGNQTDSIYMLVQFTDDPGDTYQISGHRRTGFVADELH